MKNNKKPDKTFVVLISIVAGIALFVVLSIALYDPIIAFTQLNDIKKFNIDEQIISVVYTEPRTVGDDPFSNKQIVLDGVDADKVSSEVELLLKNIKYNSTSTKKEIEWNKNIVLYNETETRTIYLGKNSIYIRKGKAVIEYTVDDDYMTEYTEFLSRFK